MYMEGCSIWNICDIRVFVRKLEYGCEVVVV